MRACAHKLYENHGICPRRRAAAGGTIVSVRSSLAFPERNYDLQGEKKSVRRERSGGSPFAPTNGRARQGRAMRLRGSLDYGRASIFFFSSRARYRECGHSSGLEGERGCWTGSFFRMRAGMCRRFLFSLLLLGDFIGFYLFE